MKFRKIYRSAQVSEKHYPLGKLEKVDGEWCILDQVNSPPQYKVCFENSVVLTNITFHETNLINVEENYESIHMAMSYDKIFGIVDCSEHPGSLL